MHRAAFPLAVLLLTGCQGCQQPLPSSVVASVPAVTDEEKQVIGLTVRDAIGRLGAKEPDCAIGDEPPGIARYVSVKRGDGRSTILWLARHPGMMREDRDWPFELVADKPVAAIGYQH